MNTLRVSLSFVALAALASAQAATSLYFGDASGNAVTSLTAPAVGSAFTLSVWLTSSVALVDGEVLVSFDRASSIGTTATPIDGLVGLGGTTATSSVAAASGFLATTVTPSGGGVGAGAGNGTGTRGYGVDVASISHTDSSAFGTTAPTRLFDLTLKNLGLTAGKSQVVSFYESPSLRYRTSLIDSNFGDVVPTVGSITVSAAPVPEPATFAALGVGALAVLRRRKRA